MFTLILAWINGHYKSELELTFAGAVLLDFVLIMGIVEIFTHN